MVRPGPNCNGNVVLTCEGWGFHLVTLAKLLFPKLRAAPAELLKSRCAPELCLSSVEEHAWLRRIVFEVNSIYSMLWSHRPQCLRPFPRYLPLSSFSTAASLLPTHHQLSPSGFYLPPLPNGRHPSPYR
uniref:Uncharacterized protein n=1 Tax=Oryza punctata TaxID=4537 RepID=A0A0E0KG89_ORYPU